MAVYVSTDDLDIHERMLAVSPSVDVDTGIWQLGDTTANGGPVAATSFPAGPGFMGSLNVDLVRAAVSLGNSTVKLYWRSLDELGAVTGSGGSSSFAVNNTETSQTLSIGPAGPGTVTCEVGIESAMTPPGDPVRVNRWLDPRCTGTTQFSMRYSWTSFLSTGLGSPPITGLTTAIRATCPATQSAAQYRGIDLYQNPDPANPTPYNGDNGISVVPGEQITISGYMYATKACTFRVGARCFSGSTWSAALSLGTGIATAANTWQRVSVTLTVPAGASYLCATFQDASANNWVSGDNIYLTGVLLENAATMQTYFDGTTVNGIGGHSVRWEGLTNNSRSLLYAGALPGGTTVQALDSSLTRLMPAEELVGAAIERDLRRSVADVWGDPQALITGGTPGLLSGQLTFLCSTLAEARRLDSVYQLPGLVTLTSDDELDGLTHRAVGRTRINPERALPGKPAKWLLVIDFREQVN